MLKIVFVITALGVAASTAFFGNQLLENTTASSHSTPQVLGISDTPSPTPAPSSFPTPTIKPTPKPTRVPISPTPSPVPVPQFSSQEMYDFYNRFAGQYGVSPDVLRHISKCESGFNPLATNHIYAGLYQFDSRTWSSFRNKMGESPDPNLRFHAEEAIKTAAYALSLGKGHIWPNCMPR